jgi:hypothetical protein
MASLPDSSNSDGEQASAPVLKGESAGAGSGGKAKTRVGAGEGEGGGAERYAVGLLEGDSERKVLYSHLKDMAIDALEMSRVKDQQTIAQSMVYVLGSYDMQPEIADVLASMVMAAYSCAQTIHDDKAIFLAYSCFTDAQLARIVKLARSG